MKSAHRHELETNALAHRLELLIERIRPYVPLIVGVVVTIAVVIFVWTFVTGTTTLRQGEAWDAYNRAIATPITSRAAAEQSLQALRQAAEEFPGSRMQPFAEVTWADGQVWLASQDYLHNRPAAMEALTRAASAYQSVLHTSRDQRLVNRARLGLARVYEMQNELERAREQYLQVGGAYADYARQQAERLAKPEAQDDYSWLATAEAPRPRAPFGPGIPGLQPEFTAGDLALPGALPEDEPPGTAPGEAATFEDLLRDLEMVFPGFEGPDRYDAADEMPSPEETEPQEQPAAPPAEDETQ